MSLEKNETDNKTKNINGNDSKETSIELELGDVIKLTAPDNQKYNNHTFIIDYIDKSKILLTNVDTLENIKLKIYENGNIGDGSIKQLSILSRSEEKGYARQNNLLPGKWINIYFGGEFPVILTGEITNLEEDMIEIKTIDGETIYINFEYKGIPEDLPIETIEIREKPSIQEEKEQIIEEPEIQEEIMLPELQIEREFKEEKVEIPIPVEKVRAEIREFILKADQIRFGDEELGPVAQFVDVSEKKQRYSIEQQVSDLLDDLLSTVPTSQRTERVLNNIHTIVERFKQLRTIFSQKDEYGNILSSLTFEADYKPLLNYFQSFSKNLYWILPVVKNKRKIYDFQNDSTSDVIYIQLDSDLKNIDEIIKNYRSNNLNSDDNKYSSLYKQLDNYFTPFENIDDENLSDIIIEKHVGDNINIITDGLGELYSTVVSNSALRSKRFFIQKYNLGLKKLVATSLTGNRMLSTRVNLTNDDVMSVKSFITLPEPTIRFSKINLPGTSILDKSNLNSIFLNYWELLKKNTYVNIINIDNITQEIEYNEDNFVNNIKNYVLSIPDEERKGLSKNEIYNEFIKKIIPKTRILFNLMKKYIKGKLSIVELVGYLEPFMIYSDNLTYMQYKDITNFIDEKISEYNKNFIEQAKLFNSLIRIILRHNRSSNAVFENMYSIISSISDKNNIRNEVFSSYDIDYTKETPFSNSEILRKITIKDYGRLYASSIALQNEVLIYPNDLTSILDTQKKDIDKNISNDTSSEECRNIIVAKRYNSEEELMKDNNIEIYFDKNLDTTNYGLIHDYEKEMATKTPDDFLKHIIEDLQKKQGINQSEAEYLADTLISGYKQVLDGQYAIIYKFTGSEEDEFVYYIRKDGKWMLDDTKINKNIINSTESNLLCNLQDKCISTTSSKQSEEKCEGVSLNELELQRDALKEIINEFDSKYYKTKQQYHEFVTNQFQYYLNILPIINKIETDKLLKYNNQKYKLSGSEESDPLIVSPFQTLLNMILAQEDFVKKQNDIVRFVNNFTRTAYTHNYGPLGKMESTYWLYCIKTGTKLLPVFKNEMAIAWIKDPETYNEFLDGLIAKIGKKSDDGDWWTAEGSGWRIKKIDFDVEEGYEEGFKVSSRDVISKDLGETLLVAKPQSYNETPETKIINNIINAMTFTLGINLEHQKSFIINCVTNKLLEILPKESDYKKFVKDMLNKNKVVPSFTDLYNSSVLYNTLGMILISIQTSIPSIKTRKTYPGCVRSFRGYPFEGNGDFTSLDYISCVSYDMRRATIEPWNVMMKKNKQYVFDKIKVAIDGTEKVRGLVEIPDVKRKMEDKTEFLLSNPLDDIPEEHNIAQWTQFLPPLVQFKLKNVVNVSSEFKEALLRDLKSGSHKQSEKIGVINFKIIQFSFAIQSAIQDILVKQTAILKNANNVPYLENACCNELGNNNALGFFMKQDENISQYNKFVENLTNILDDIERYTKSIILCSEVNTKNKYPEISTTFDEQTIYSAFVHFCKFKTVIAIPEYLLPICSEKPEQIINPNDSLTEIIKKLKHDGRNYTLENFLRMLQLVAKHNIINIDYDNPALSSISALVSVIENIDAEDDEVVEPALRKLILNSLDTFNIASDTISKETKALNDYLLRNNENMKEDIIKFINDNKGNNQNITKRSLKNLTSFVNTLNKWYSEDSSINLDKNISNDSLYNSINYYKMFIDNLISVFPNIIINKVDYTNVNIPSYWGFSNIHNIKLKNNIKNYYDSLKVFYDDVSLQKLLNTIQKTSKNIKLISKVIPAFTSIQLKDKMLKPIFDERTSKLLFEYLLLRIFINYIDLSEDKDMIVRQVSRETTIEEIFTVDYVQEKDTRTDIEFSSKNEKDIVLLRGDQKELRHKTAYLITIFMKIMETHKDNINISYDQIQDTIFKLKESEKTRITERLKKLSDEERDADTILKINKLGPWDKGLRKGLTQYVAETYDEDREFMDEMERIERNVKSKIKGVNDENIDIYMEDFIQEKEVADDIEKDAYDIGFLTEDFYDGNYDAIDAPETENYDDYN
jgi:hypothetical protein